MSVSEDPVINDISIHPVIDLAVNATFGVIKAQFEILDVQVVEILDNELNRGHELRLPHRLANGEKIDKIIKHDGEYR